MKDHADLLAAAKGMLTRDEPPLRVVPPAEDGEPTQPMEVVPAAPAPVVLAGRQMGFLDQMRAQASHTRMLARQARHTKGGVFHRLYHGQPRSMAMQADHVRNRRWVKPEYKGGIADKGGTGYHKLIGNQMVATGAVIAAIGGSPIAFFYSYLGALSLAELSLWLFGDSMIAFWVAVINVAVAVAIVLTLAALTGRQDDGEPETAEPAEITEPEEG